MTVPSERIKRKIMYKVNKKQLCYIWHNFIFSVSEVKGLPLDLCHIWHNLISSVYEV